MLTGCVVPLPLATLKHTPPSPSGDNAPVDTLEAAARLVRNSRAVARFAARGPGQPGPRPVSAPLADPTAIPAEEWIPAVDAALRCAAWPCILLVQCCMLLVAFSLHSRCLARSSWLGHTYTPAWMHGSVSTNNVVCRHVAHALLVGPETKQLSGQALKVRARFQEEGRGEALWTCPSATV